MKVFEVTTEYEVKGRIETANRYVTINTDSITDVFAYFRKRCEDVGENLVGIREILTVTNQITKDI